MLETLVTIVAALVVVALLAATWFALLRSRSRRSSLSGKWPFSLRRPLTEPEQELYFRLCQALPDHMVLARGGLSRFIAVRRGHDARDWHHHINRMSIDFLVCTRDANVVAAIELDDASRRASGRLLMNAKKDKALAAAGVRLIRWNANALPDESAIPAILPGVGTAGEQGGPAQIDPTTVLRTAPVRL